MVDIDEIMKLILTKADALEKDATWGGDRKPRWEAIALREQVKFYKYGEREEFPKEWNEYTVKLDPEYETFLRLKNKFEGR